MWWWALARAAAVDPTPVLEIRVVEERTLAEAREGIDVQLKGKGYLRIWRIGDRTWYLNPKLWKPGVVVHDEGFARVRGRRFYPMGVFPTERGQEVYAVVQTRRQVQQQKARLVADLEPYLRQIRDATWQLARADRAVAIRDELVGIWVDGIDAGGSEHPTYLARRRALSDRWLQTADGEAGRWARGIIGAFIDAEVQTSDHPFGDREIARVQASNPHPQPFLPVDPRGP